MHLFTFDMELLNVGSNLTSQKSNVCKRTQIIGIDEINI